MHPLHILLLQWQGLVLHRQQVWEILGLNEQEIFVYFRSRKIQISKTWLEQAKRDLNLCLENSLKLIPFWHPHYPDDLKLMNQPPLVLCCKGDTSVLKRSALAVVGSRKMNFTSAKWIETELADFLRRSDAVVSSGGAFGVDQKAHLVSVLHGRPTVCWLPSGLLEFYPNQFKSHSEEIVNSGGLVVSTYAPDKKMRKYHFVQRNQFIAATAQLTLIVQAKRKSGTLITAKAAADYGKEIAVLPSAPTEEGLGGLDLISEGAHMVRDANDLYALYSSLMVQQVSPFPSAKT